MRLKIASALAMAGLLGACQTPPVDTPKAMDAMSMGAHMAAEPVPGSVEEFKAKYPDRVFFALNQSSVSAESELLLAKQAEWLKMYPHMAIVLEGHCDERGTVEYNLALGEKRAVSVKKHLIALGVDAHRIKVVSYGKQRPVVEGSTQEAWAQNRVTVTLVE